MKFYGLKNFGLLYAGIHFHSFLHAKMTVHFIISTVHSDFRVTWYHLINILNR